MSDNTSVKKKSQQAILNYISVNFQKMDVNNQNEKSSAETAPSAHRTPKEQRPEKYSRFNKFSNGGPQTRKTSVGTNSASKSSNVANPSLNPKTTCTPTNSTEMRNNKSRTPPSIESTINPKKKLMMESITSSNIETTHPTAKTSSTGPSSNSDTIRHNNEATATRRNQQSSGHNEDTSTTRNNDETTNPRCNQKILEGNENIATPRGNIEETTTNGPASATAVPIIIENPMEVEGMKTDESLDDLGPELAKLGRILAKEITKSLSNALIPLQNDIIQLHADTA